MMKVRFYQLIHKTKNILQINKNNNMCDYNIL